jgi:PhnB protein
VGGLAANSSPLFSTIARSLFLDYCSNTMSEIGTLVRRWIETLHTSHTMTTSNSATVVQPYLFFGGRCEEALEFYRKTIGAQVEMLMRHEESPEPPPPGMLAEGFENKIMHSSFRVGATTIMASDGCSPEEGNFNGFMLSLTVPGEADADRVFGALSEGGNVKMPLSKTFWSPKFGMLTDRFGLGWMITVAA